MVAKATTSNSSTGTVVFELGEAELTAIEPKPRGRAQTPSVYADHILAVLASGKAAGIHTSATLKAPWIMAQLRKAERQYNATNDSKIKVQIFDRSDEVKYGDTKPFVGFRVVKVEAETAEATAAE